MSPTFTIVTSFGAGIDSHTIESVRSQDFPGHDWVWVGSGSTHDLEMHPLATDLNVEMFDVESRGPFGVGACTGEFIVWLDSGDRLPAHSLAVLAERISQFPEVDIVYTDCDLISPNGQRTRSFQKPAWSPDRLRLQDYVGDLLAIRRDLLAAVADDGLAVDDRQSRWDLVLRAGEQARQVAHIPQALYYRRSDSHIASTTGVDHVQRHLERTGFPATAELTEVGTVRLSPDSFADRTVSVVIPTGGAVKVVGGERKRLVENAVESVVTLSTHPAIEVIVVLDRNADESLADCLEALDPTRVRCVRDHNPFNFSAACNLGAAYAGGDLLCFLNDDAEVVTPGWIEAMVMYATRPDTGAVGARLEYGDGRVQHAGIGSRNGYPGHLYPGYPNDHSGLYGALTIAQNVLAVTGACLMVETSKFFAVGGFSTELPLNYNDVDLCLKLNAQGWGAVVDCSTVLIHYESATRQPEMQLWELEFLETRWGSQLSNSPYDNPNLHTPGVSSYPATPPVITRLQELLEHGRYPTRVWPFGANPST